MSSTPGSATSTLQFSARPQVGTAPASRTRRGAHRRNAVVGYLYLAPALVLVGAFVLAPFAHSAWLSLFDWNGLTVGTFVGPDNYVELAQDPEIRSAFWHAVVLALFFSLIPITLALILASCVVTVRVHGALAFRTLLFLPQVLSTVVVGVIWSWLLTVDGPVNGALSAIGLGSLGRTWLGDFTTALPAVGLIGAWSITGLCLVLFVAGMQQIPPTLYDAARIDGAGRIREFFAVTLPGLRGQVIVAFVLTVIGGLRTFDTVYVLTRGGPGRSTITPGYLIYSKAFQTNEVGLACAAGVALALVILAVLLVTNRLTERG